MRVRQYQMIDSGGIKQRRSAAAYRVRCVAALSAIVALVVLPCSVGAAGSSGPTIALFGGQNLRGWTLARGQVVVDQSMLVVSAAARLVYTDFPERNMILRLKYQRRGTDSATPLIYYHSDFSAATSQLRGNFIRLHPARWRRSYRLGAAPAWNQLELCITDGRGTITVNGQRVGTIHCADQTGYIALGAAGNAGTAVAFKDISVTELDHQTLFNGHDLKGWEGAGQPAAQCWNVSDGLLFCTGQKGPWLRSKRSYSDFDLRLQYRLKPGGNSGVYIRVPTDGNHHGAGAGVEVQILDDAAARYRNLKPYQFAGSLYAVVAASPRVSRPAGQWNSLEITCRGKHYTVRHNGRIVIDVDGSQNPELAARRTRGYLGLQNHSETVWFRNLRIETL